MEVKIPAFKVTTVFDVSQTYGKELPTLGVNELTQDVTRAKDFMEALKIVSPVPIEFGETKGESKGFYSLSDQSITIKEGMSDAEYEELLRVRIRGMLKAAAYKGYRHLVLGAFGCGAFVNDARTVAKAFKDVFDTFRFPELNMDQLFASVDFAVLCRRDTYNYDQFHALFHDE